MEQLRYIGNHRPLGMIVDVKEKDVRRLLDSGDYERAVVQAAAKTIPKKKEEVKDDSILIKSTKRF